MPEIIIREIEEDDLEKGFLETLDFLRNASDLDKNKANEILKKWYFQKNHKKILPINKVSLMFKKFKF